MKTHKFDSISFLAGVLITVIGLAFLLLPGIGNIIDFFVDARAWFWPAVFIVVGFAVLVPVVTRREGLEGEEESPESDI